MYSRLVVPLVCAAAIVFACGPRPHGTTAATPASMAGRLRLSGTDAAGSAALKHRAHRLGDTTRIDAALAVAPTADGILFALLVVNLDKKQVEIDFPNGQTRDFVVLDATGHEVWRWSRGRLFTQTVQNKFLSGGDTAVYAEHWEPTQPGEYTAVAILRSGNFPLERRASFEVRPSSLVAAGGPVTAGFIH